MDNQKIKDYLARYTLHSREAMPTARILSLVFPQLTEQESGKIIRTYQRRKLSYYNN